ncbi:MAG: hypothetical protein ACH37Z_06225 [Anaerolineae bacterium]|jgi:hypothetical protein|nr:hypothetical protein [Anaerolineae bacterium]HRA20373.1 hypothetical protein [Anaerolineae bacterium]
MAIHAVDSDLADPPEDQAPSRGWSWPLRIAFRYLFSYFALYNLAAVMGVVTRFVASVVRLVFQGSVGPGAAAKGGLEATIQGLLDAPLTAYERLLHRLVPLVGKQVLHLPKDITVFPNGSGDTTFNYVEVLVFAVVAAVITVLWSLIALRRRDHRRLHDLLRVELRYVLAMSLISYGLAKVFVLQFPPATLDQLVMPYGESSPMGVLWRFMGASQPYQIFGGATECFAGLLLLWRRTTLLGACLALGVMGNVAMLNYSYDVPVKLYSTHLVAMVVTLILPDLGRLTSLFALNRPVAPAILRPFAEPPGWGFVRLSAKLVFLCVTFVTMVASQLETTKTYGLARPKPPLYGLYEVESFNLDGSDRPALLTDGKRWRRVTVSRWGTIAFTTMDGRRQEYDLTVDFQKRTMAVSALRFQEIAEFKPGPPLATFTFDLIDPGRLAFEGEFRHTKLQVKLKRLDESSFLINSRGFHWINEVPFNR